MKLIGKDNGHMSDLKFLYSAVDELSNKDEITVTDFLALSAFVTSEKLDLESYQSGLEEGGKSCRKTPALTSIFYRGWRLICRTQPLALRTLSIAHNQRQAGLSISGGWIKNNHPAI